MKAGGLKVLDVGCGPGVHAALLAEYYQNCRFVGIDISQEAIAEAKNRKSL